MKSVSGCLLLTAFLTLTVTAGDERPCDEHEAESRSWELGPYFVADDLFEDSDGDLMFRTTVLWRNRNGVGRSRSVYQRLFGRPTLPDRQGPTLTEVVDRESWEQIAFGIYRDKAHTYCRYTDTSGGFLRVLEGTPEDFRFYHEDGWLPYDAIVARATTASNPPDKNDQVSPFTTDGESIYYRCNALEDADPDTFEVMRYQDGRLSWLARDADNLYDGYDRITVIEALGHIEDSMSSGNAEARAWAVAYREFIGSLAPHAPETD